ncbi:MAG: hypothetical protein IKH75_10255 [Ruminococcus sp.]|nr:hypothetical protein [Ruminococcus sp.]
MILLDGHNRMKISAEHGGIPFQVVEKEFGSREEAIVWVSDNQLGRRNISKYDRLRLEDRKREAIAAIAKRSIGGDKKSEEYKKSLPTNVGSDPESKKTESQLRRERSTDYRIAKAAGASESTLRRVRAIEKSGDTELIQQIRSGDTTINQAYNEIMIKQAEAEGRIPQTQTQKKRQEVVAAYERHEAYDQSGVASIADARQDREDRKTIALEWYGRMKNALKDLYWTGALNKTEVFAEMRKALTDEDRKKLVNRIQDACMVLNTALSELED